MQVAIHRHKSHVYGLGQSGWVYTFRATEGNASVHGEFIVGRDDASEYLGTVSCPDGSRILGNEAGEDLLCPADRLTGYSAVDVWSFALQGLNGFRRIPKSSNHPQ